MDEGVSPAVRYNRQISRKDDALLTSLRDRWHQYLGIRGAGHQLSCYSLLDISRGSVNYMMANGLLFSFFTTVLLTLCRNSSGTTYDGRNLGLQSLPTDIPADYYGLNSIRHRSKWNWPRRFCWNYDWLERSEISGSVVDRADSCARLLQWEWTLQSGHNRADG